MYKQVTQVQKNPTKTKQKAPRLLTFCPMTFLISSCNYAEVHFQLSLVNYRIGVNFPVRSKYLIASFTYFC